MDSADVMAAACGAGVVVLGFMSALKFLTGDRGTDRSADGQPEHDDSGRKAR